VVIPSLPGHGSSGKPTDLGWNPERVAHAWIELMSGLGYTRYVAQGGDWGNTVIEQMALLAPPGLLAIHTNMHGAVPADIAQAPLSGEQPQSLSADERQAYGQLKFFYDNGLGYAQEISHGRKHCMRWTIRRLALPLGCSTMTLAVMNSSREPSPAKRSV
jgi:pimeloyl-ACP methyl ester carboxylesterase